jgi:hypothetical protein
MTGTQHSILPQYLELQVCWANLDHETKLGLPVFLPQLPELSILSFMSFPVSLYVTETISLQPASVDKAGSFPTGSDDISIVAVLEVLWSLSARVA